jgi:RNA polymerase sigma factor (sigma-70 family)
MLSFEEACEKFRPLLLKLAKEKTGCFNTAEDIVQDTLISAWKSHQGYYNCSFFVTILHRRLADHFRKIIGRTRRAMDKVDESNISPTDALKSLPFVNVRKEDPATISFGNYHLEPAIKQEVPLSEKYSDEVIQAFRQLPKKFMEPAILILLMDATYEEAAQVLDIPVGTVFSRVNRVRLLLNQNKELKSLCRAA